MTEEPIRVVVVDDEPDLLLLLRLSLESMGGFEVVAEAADGDEGLEVCRRERPDVVVMDLLMPRMSGFAAIPMLQDELAETGIVAYSAVAGDFAREECARLGVDLVLKSGDIGPLAQALRRAARRHGHAPHAR